MFLLRMSSWKFFYWRPSPAAVMTYNNDNNDNDNNDNNDNNNSNNSNNSNNNNNHSSDGLITHCQKCNCGTSLSSRVDWLNTLNT
jgi:hypothetical protein